MSQHSGLAPRNISEIFGGIAKDSFNFYRNFGVSGLIISQLRVDEYYCYKLYYSFDSSFPIYIQGLLSLNFNFFSWVWSWIKGFWSLILICEFDELNMDLILIILIMNLILDSRVLDIVLESLMNLNFILILTYLNSRTSQTCFWIRLSRSWLVFNLNVWILELVACREI